MEPVFIYFDKVKFDNSNFKTYTVKFSDGDLLDGVLFKSANDYYITSMSSFITIEKNLKELKDYDDIKKISDIVNDNGINHYEKSIPLLSCSIFGGQNKKLVQDNSKQASSVVKIEYLDVNTKNSNSIKIYSGYENLRLYGLKFSNEDLSFNLKLVEENGELYISKKMTLLKNENTLLNDAITNSYTENIIMIKDNGQYQPVFIPIARYYNSRKKLISLQKFDAEIQTHKFVYNSLFTGFFRYFNVLTNKKTSMSSRFPLWIGENEFIIYPNTEIYFTPSLYAKLKQKLKFTGDFIVLTDTDVIYLKARLFAFKGNKKFYPFVNKNPNATWKFRANDFTLTDDYIDITTPIVDKRNIFAFRTDDKNETIKVKAPKDLIKKLQSQELNLLQSLSKKIDTKSLTYAYENFFLYDLENMIKSTFTTELQKEFNIYGLIYFSGEAKENNKLHLVRPKSKLKFQFGKDTYKKEIKFELSKVHKKKTFNVVGDYISNFSMLRTEKYGIGQKRKVDFELVDEIPILGIQNSEFNVLNPIYVSISSDAIITKLQLYKNYRYRFVLQSLLFSSNIVNDTDVIIVTANGLSNTKQALIKRNNQSVLESTLGVCFLSEIPDWNIIKRQSKRTQAVFSDSEDLNRSSDHLAFSFITKNISDLLQFSVTLLDGAGKEIAFPTNETKLPIVTFRIQIIK